MSCFLFVGFPQSDTIATQTQHVHKQHTTTQQTHTQTAHHTTATHTHHKHNTTTPPRHDTHMYSGGEVVHLLFMPVNFPPVLFFLFFLFVLLLPPPLVFFFFFFCSIFSCASSQASRFPCPQPRPTTLGVSRVHTHVVGDGVGSLFVWFVACGQGGTKCKRRRTHTVLGKKRFQVSNSNQHTSHTSASAALLLCQLSNQQAQLLFLAAPQPNQLHTHTHTHTKPISSSSSNQSTIVHELRSSHFAHSSHQKPKPSAATSFLSPLFSLLSPSLLPFLSFVLFWLCLLLLTPSTQTSTSTQLSTGLCYCSSRSLFFFFSFFFFLRGAWEVQIFKSHARRSSLLFSFFHTHARTHAHTNKHFASRPTSQPKLGTCTTPLFCNTHAKPPILSIIINIIIINNNTNGRKRLSLAVSFSIDRCFCPLSNCLHATHGHAHSPP